MFRKWIQAGVIFGRKPGSSTSHPDVDIYATYKSPTVGDGIAWRLKCFSAVNHNELYIRAGVDALCCIFSLLLNLKKCSILPISFRVPFLGLGQSSEANAISNNMVWYIVCIAQQLPGDDVFITMKRKKLQLNSILCSLNTRQIVFKTPGVDSSNLVSSPRYWLGLTQTDWTQIGRKWVDRDPDRF